MKWQRESFDIFEYGNLTTEKDDEKESGVYYVSTPYAMIDWFNGPVNFRFICLLIDATIVLLPTFSRGPP